MGINELSNQEFFEAIRPIYLYDIKRSFYRGVIYPDHKTISCLFDDFNIEIILPNTFISKSTAKEVDYNMDRVNTVDIEFVFDSSSVHIATCGTSVAAINDDHINLHHRKHITFNNKSHENVLTDNGGIISYEPLGDAATASISFEQIYSMPYNVNELIVNAPENINEILMEKLL